jgi:hypothetical protein
MTSRSASVSSSPCRSSASYSALQRSRNRCQESMSPAVHGDEAARSVDVAVEARVDTAVSTREQPRPGAVRCVRGDEGPDLFRTHPELTHPDEREGHSSPAPSPPARANRPVSPLARAVRDGTRLPLHAQHLPTTTGHAIGEARKSATDRRVCMPAVGAGSRRVRTSARADAVENERQQPEILLVRSASGHAHPADQLHQLAVTDVGPDHPGLFSAGQQSPGRGTDLRA